MSIRKTVTNMWQMARFLGTRARLRALARVRPDRHPQALLEAWLTPISRGRPSGPVSHWHWSGEERVALYDEGKGPTVLLVHGWEGSALDMRELASAFARAGYRALRLDLPAHGASTGRWTTLAHWARTIRDVTDRAANGELAAIVGHSLGTAACLLAVRDGMKANCAVLLAPPREPRSYFTELSRALGVPDERRDDAMRLLEEMVGPIDEFDSRLVARCVNAPGLVIHDRGDRQVPYEHGQGIADAWPGAELVTIEGLGHRRMLTNPDVIGRVVGFVDAQRYTSPARASRA